MKKLFLPYLLLLLAGNAWALPVESIPTTVEAIKCEGNLRTRCSHITSHLGLKAGDRIDDNEIANAKLRLATVFEKVDIRLEKGAADHNVIVVIQVVEGKAFQQTAYTGTVADNSDFSQTIGGSFSYADLFGMGKSLTLSGNIKIPINEMTGAPVYAELEYVDPKLFGSDKYFLSTRLAYSFDEKENPIQNVSLTHNENFGADLFMGRRFFKYSYFGAGYTYYFFSDQELTGKDSSGVVAKYTYDYNHLLRFSYGWNSEDDNFFPTRGSVLKLSIGGAFDKNHTKDSFSAFSRNNINRSLNDIGLFYRVNLVMTKRAILTFKIGEATDDVTPFSDFFLSATYAQQFYPKDSDLQKVRWYLESGLTRYVSAKTDDETIAAAGAKLGLRFKFKSFGVVDFYLFGSFDYKAEGGIK